MVIVLFGVTGSGKTTVGKLLAEDLGWEFLDADDYHSAENIAKMTAGAALNDEDRRGWLEALRELIETASAEKQNLVMACSALRTAYREYLASDDDVRFILLNAGRKAIEDRLATRTKHFMNPGLIQSQFEILEAARQVHMIVDSSLPPRACVSLIRSTLVESKGS